MAPTNLAKAALLMAIIVTAAVTSWEIYLRSKGFAVSYDEGPPLWSHKRGMVYKPINEATVFIGSSRNKYDLDIETWRNITGEEPVQLAMEGMNPLPIMDDLANDKNFKGKLVVDVTEGLFFSISPSDVNAPKDNIKFYKELTPAQKASFHINHLLESQFVFLDKYDFSIGGMLDKLEIPSRKGVFMMPIFPRDFGPVNFDRQDIMTQKFLTDTNLPKKVQNIWMFFANMSKDNKPMSGNTLDSLIKTVKGAVDKITARGGKVLFVRTPSSGPYWQGEQMAYPRDKYWDRLLKETNSPGIHFKDYPAIDHFICPEWSHLSQKDAVVFTKELARILQEEKGWQFAKHSSE